MTDRMVSPPSLSRDRKYTHLRVVCLRLEGNLVYYICSVQLPICTIVFCVCYLQYSLSRFILNNLINSDSSNYSPHLKSIVQSVAVLSFRDVSFFPLLYATHARTGFTTNYGVYITDLSRDIIERRMKGKASRGIRDPIYEKSQDRFTTNLDNLTINLR